MSKDRVLENKLTKRLNKETEDVTKLKDEVWNNISTELFPAQVKKARTNWIKGIVATLGTVAVAVIMFFGLLSGNFTDQTKDDPIQEDPVQNDPDTGGDKDRGDDPENTEQEIPLKDQFEHEKEVEIEVEGMKETINVQLATNETWRYYIYFDKDSYRFIQGEEMDEIIFAEELDDQYPEVGMEIRKITDLSVEEAITNVKESLASDGMSIVHEKSIDWPIDAVMITGEGAEGNQVQWNTPVHRYYITEGENDSLFVFKQKLFVEAQEGHALRFDWMLESFEIVE